MQTAEIIQLFKYRQQFEEEGGGDLASFSVWLRDKLSPKEIDNQVFISPKDVSEQTQNRHPIPPTNLAESIGRTWGRLIRFTYFLGKKAMEGLPIRSPEDFGVLMFVAIMQNPKKSEVSEHSLLEKTTCFEIIKRLIRHELLHEEIDAKDKRAKRIRVTKKGIDILKIAQKRMYETSEILTGNLSITEKKRLLEVLRYLDNFHTYLHEYQQDKTLSELIELNIHASEAEPHA